MAHCSPVPLSPSLVNRGGDDILLESTLTQLISMETLLVERRNPIGGVGFPGNLACSSGAWGREVSYEAPSVYEVGLEGQPTPRLQGALAVYISVIMR